MQTCCDETYVNILLVQVHAGDQRTLIPQAVIQLLHGVITQIIMQYKL